MEKTVKVTTPVIIKAPSKAPNNKVLNQLIQCVQGGNDEVRKYLEDECDVIIECKVCRNLFRGLPNFLAHKRVFCTQRHAANQVQSVFGEGKAIQNEAVIVLCDHSESHNSESKATAKSNTSGPNATSDLKTNNVVVGRTEQRNPVPAQSASSNSGTVRVSAACTSASSAQPQSKLVESTGKVKAQVSDCQTQCTTSSETNARSVRERLADRNDCDLKRLACLTCDIIYDSVNSLGAHMELRHEQGTRLYPCPTCMREVTDGTAKKQEVMSFSSVGSTIRHMTMCHGMNRDQAQTFKRRIAHLSYVVPEAASDLRLRRLRNREFAARLAQGCEQSPIEILESSESTCDLAKPTEGTKASTDSQRKDSSEASQPSPVARAAGTLPVNVVVAKQGDRKRRFTVPVKRVRLEERSQLGPVCNNNNVGDADEDENEDADEAAHLKCKLAQDGQVKAAKSCADTPTPQTCDTAKQQEQQTAPAHPCAANAQDSATGAQLPDAVDCQVQNNDKRSQPGAHNDSKTLINDEKNPSGESELANSTVPALASPPKVLKPTEMDQQEVASETNQKPVATPTATSFISDELSDYASGKGYGCIMCTSSFSRLSALKNHLARSHSLALIEQHDSSSNSWFNASFVDLANDSIKSRRSKRKRCSKQRTEPSDAQHAADDELCDDDTQQHSLSLDDDADSKKSGTQRKPLTRDPPAVLGPESQLPEMQTQSKPSVAQSASEIAPQPVLATQRRVRTKADLLAFLRTKRESAPSDPPAANSNQS